MGSETKWTPGPWFFNDDWHVYPERFEDHDNHEEQRALIASVSPWDGNPKARIFMDQAIANRALIAASPSLYEALDELLEFACSDEADYSAPHEYEAVRDSSIKRARAALARARQESPDVK